MTPPEILRVIESVCWLTFSPFETPLDNVLNSALDAAFEIMSLNSESIPAPGYLYSFGTDFNGSLSCSDGDSLAYEGPMVHYEVQPLLYLFNPTSLTMSFYRIAPRFNPMGSRSRWISTP